MGLLDRVAAVAVLALMVGVQPAVAQSAPSAPAPAASAPAEEVPTGRLPQGVTPLRYALDLELDPDKDGFTGTASIAVRLDKPAATIWLHGRDLAVDSVTAVPANGTPVPGTWAQANKDGVARVSFPAALPAGRHTLVLRYKADYDKRLSGIYKTTDAGRHYLFSQFQAISARKAWPGFDEPRFKTPFDISVTVKAGDTAVSNTGVLREEALPDGRRKVVFRTTEPLPTYLLAFAVGPLDVVEGPALPPNAVRKHPVPLRGVAAKGKGKGERMRRALAETGAMVEVLERYFGMPYPFDKLDLIAAVDFGAGAMENAGAIVYAERRILVGDETPAAELRAYANTHMHELAHMWFGDLVTPAWWDDLWLNESFATWMAAKAVAEWQPGQGLERVVQGDAIEAMDLDSLASTRRIRQPIDSVNDISNAFDAITYRKGGGVLNMVERYLGPDRFREAVRTHLKRHAGGVATSEDFFRSVADTAGDPRLVEVLKAFVGQTGVPLVSADWTCDAGGKATVTLTQSRYAPLGSAIEAKQAWPLPVCLRSAGPGGEEVCGLVEGPAARFDLPTNQCPAAIVPNAGGAGYYRFTVPADKWAALVSALPTLPPAEQLAVLDSLWAGVAAGHADAGEFMGAALSVAPAGTQDVTSMNLRRLRTVLDTLLDPAGRPAAQQALARAYRPVLDRVGLVPGGAADKADPINTGLLRAELARFLALDLRDPDTRAKLTDMARRGIGFGVPAEPAALPGDLSDTALAVAAQELGRPFVERLGQEVAASTDSLARVERLRAMARVTEPELAGEVRDLVFGELLRVSEVRRLLEAHAEEPANRDALWAWMRDNAAKLSKAVGPGGTARLSRYVEDGCTTARRDEVKATLQPLMADAPGGPRTLEQSLERITLCAALADAQKGRVGERLK